MEINAPGMNSTLMQDEPDVAGERFHERRNADVM
jgi:hypothetical protein